MFFVKLLLTTADDIPHTIVYQIDSLIAAILRLKNDAKLIKFTFDYENLFFFILVIVSLMILLKLIVKIFYCLILLLYML